MSVLPLPSEVVCKIRSGIAITSFGQCLNELVLNAIDAFATNVCVRLDLSSHRISVKDNGKGIPSDQLQFIGERYFTSKCHNLKDLNNLKYFGYRGEALASLREVSGIIEIVSKCSNCSDTFSKLFVKGKTEGVTKCSIKISESGTIVSVINLMYNMPVRQNMISNILDLEHCRNQLANIALIHSNISFVLINEITEEIVLQTHKSNSILTNFITLYGQKKAKNLKKVECVLSPYEIKGYISLDSHHSKDYQFIYVNNRHVLKTKLHKITNLLLKKYLLIKHRGSKDISSSTPNSNSPSKNSNQHAIFILNIKCPFNKYDLCLEPQKSLIEFKEWRQVLKCLQEAVYAFLIDNEITDKSISCNQLFSPINEKELCDKDIDIHNTKNALFSLAAKRPLFSESVEENNNNSVGNKSENNIRDSKNNKLEENSKIHSINQFKISSFENSKKKKRICIDPSNSEAIRHTLADFKKKNNCKKSSSIEDKLCNSNNSITLSLKKKSDEKSTFHLLKYNDDDDKLIKLKKLSENIKKNNLNTKESAKWNTNVKTLKVDCVGDFSDSNDKLKHLKEDEKRNKTVVPDNVNKTCVDFGENILNINLTNCIKNANNVTKICFNDIKLTPQTKSISGKKLLSKTLNYQKLNSYKNKQNQIDKNFPHEVTTIVSSTNDSNKICCDKHNDDIGLSITDESCTDLNCENVEESLQKNWLCHKDLNLDKYVYINKNNGNSAYFNPERRDESQIEKTVGNQEKTHFFLSHNATPFYSQKLKDKAKQFKLQNAKSIISETSDNNILGMLHKWRNPVFQKQDLNEIIDTSIKNISRTTIKVYNLTQPHSLSKSDLNHAKVIGQVDCKFIACLIPKIEKFQSRDLIVLFDQHAVHERIRLEKLIKDSYENNSEEQNVKLSSLDVPISVHLRPEEMRMLKAYECHLEKIGLKVTVDDDSIRVHSVPSCLFEKISNESKKKTTRINTIIENLLQEWMEITQLTGNKVSSLPKTLLNVLNSQACRSAIKFGDPLSKDECRKLLGLLTLCKLPFQCAHGRPDLVPVADLDHLKKLEPLMQKPQLQKLTERLRRNKSPNQKTDSVTSCK